MTQRSAVFLSALLIAVLGFSIYANSLKCEFIWDDKPLIRDNPRIKDLRGAPALFTQGMTGEPAFKSGYYRPLQLLFHSLGYSAWKLDVKGYHLTSVFFHIMTSLALYFLVNSIFRDKFLSIVAGMLYLAHPVHVEAVAYISGLSDPLAAFFMLVSFICYIKELRSPSFWRYLVMISACALAFLSKESSVILPLLFLVYHYSFREKIKVRAFAPIAACAIIYIAVKAGASAPGISWIISMPERIPGVFAAIANYMRLAAAPSGLHMDYGAKLFRPGDTMVITGFVITASLLYTAFAVRKKTALFSFSILWFFAALLPVLNLYPVSFYMAEHFLYLPAMGLALLASGIINVLYRKAGLKVCAVALAAVATAFYSSCTVKQVDRWIEPMRFYERTLRFTPDSLMAVLNIADTYETAGHRRKALLAYKKALEINPRLAANYYNLGRLYAGLAEPYEAERLYRKAVDIDPRYARAYDGLGIVYAKRGDFEKAASFFKKAAASDPSFAKAYNNIGSMYLAMGLEEEAVEYFRDAVRLGYDIKPEALRLLVEAADTDPALRTDPQLSGIMERYGKKW